MKATSREVYWRARGRFEGRFTTEEIMSALDLTEIKPHKYQKSMVKLEKTLVRQRDESRRSAVALLHSCVRVLR